LPFERVEMRVHKELFGDEEGAVAKLAKGIFEISN
jgi:hypothetical protein